MRIGAILLVGIGLLSAAVSVSSSACSVNTSSDLICTAGGGQCIANTPNGAPPEGCGEQVSGALCDDGYTCCTVDVNDNTSSGDAGTTTDAVAPVAATDATAG